MYLAVLIIVAGWSILYLSMWLAFYLLFLTVVFHLRVLMQEEPWLRRQFGTEWEAYSASTARWIPRLRLKSK